MMMIYFKHKVDKEHELEKAYKMLDHVEDYIKCLEDSIADEEEYSERRGRGIRMRGRYDKYDDEEPRRRMR